MFKEFLIWSGVGIQRYIFAGHFLMFVIFRFLFTTTISLWLEVGIFISKTALNLCSSSSAVRKKAFKLILKNKRPAAA